MNLLLIAEASLKLGIPLGVLSWVMFSWLHSEGKLDIAANRKTIESNLKQMKKTHKSEKVAQAKQGKLKKTSLKEKLQKLNFMHANNSPQDQTSDSANMIFDRWMWFGSGFYGLAALWTFVIVEIQDMLRFITTFPGFAEIFKDGVVHVIVDLIVNQIMNIVSAFIWFTYWSDGSMITWVVVAYLGYLAGLKVAKYQRK